MDSVDGQTIISREGGRRRLTVRCDVVGRDQGGFVREAQERFEAEIRPLVPAARPSPGWGCSRTWSGPATTSPS
jgi:Cu/Ag efflux pump CusA